MITLQERNALVLQYNALACKIALQLYNRRPMVRRMGTVDDVKQLGQVALIRAAELYDKNHPSGAKFITYATWAIKNAILNRASESGLIRVPNASHQASLRGTRAWHKLKAETLQKARRAIQLRLLPGRPELTWIEDRRLTLCLDTADVGPALRRLDGRTRLVIERYYGLDGQPEENLAQIGRYLRISRERVRQIAAAGLEKLRHLIDPEAA